MTNYRLCWSLDRIEAPSLPPRQRHLEVLNFKEPSRFQGLLPLEDPVGRRKSHWTPRWAAAFPQAHEAESRTVA